VEQLPEPPTDADTQPEHASELERGETQAAEGPATPEGSDNDEEEEEGETLFTIPKDNARMEAMLPELPEFRVCDLVSKRSIF
jgi:hypothetical protein